MTERADQSKRLRGNRCVCAECGHIFSSVSAFDSHLAPFDDVDWEDPDRTPCLPVEVFAAARPNGRRPRLVWHPKRHLWVTRLDDRDHGEAA